MKRNLLITMVATLACVTLVHAQRREVTYDYLIANQRDNLGKEVRLSAIWTYGFEWTYLCSAECKDLPRAWVTIDAEDKLCKGTSSRLKKLGKKFDNRARVIVTGRLESGGFGHMGGYSRQFTINCIEKFEKIY